jgi:uncharacterized membrane protein
MTPTLRKIIYAVSFETLGILVGSLGLLIMSDAKPMQSLILSALTASVAMAWSMGFNAAFEAWEARQLTRGRSHARRISHALLFEGGLLILVLPIMAWWLQISLWQTLRLEAGLIALFIAYTYVFTRAFDHIFGLPESAR